MCVARLMRGLSLSTIETVAQKALAYGMPTVQVDGNDLFAVYKASKEAIDREVAQSLREALDDLVDVPGDELRRSLLAPARPPGLARARRVAGERRPAPCGGRFRILSGFAAPLVWDAARKLWECNLKVASLQRGAPQFGTGCFWVIRNPATRQPTGHRRRVVDVGRAITLSSARTSAPPGVGRRPPPFPSRKLTSSHELNPGSANCQLSR